MKKLPFFSQSMFVLFFICFTKLVWAQPQTVIPDQVQAGELFRVKYLAPEGYLIRNIQFVMEPIHGGVTSFTKEQIDKSLIIPKYRVSGQYAQQVQKDIFTLLTKENEDNWRSREIHVRMALNQPGTTLLRITCFTRGRDATPLIKEFPIQVLGGNQTVIPSPEEPIYVGGDVLPPLKISAPQPQYTEEARKARVQGVVVVQAVIDTQGNVTSIKVLKGLPMGLSEEAIKMIKEWKFEPATLNGKPVSVYYNLTANFRLN